MNVLIVEDDPILGKQVSSILAGCGHACKWLRGTRPITSEDIGDRFDAIIIDISLPGQDGVEVVKSLREEGVRTPVIFLSALNEVADRVRGLRGGGDDYLTKPFASEELLARLEILVKRGAPGPAAPCHVAGWNMDSVKRRIHSDNGTVELQPREWALLELFMRESGSVLSKSYLLEKVWDTRFDPGTNVVDAMICKLRGKLASVGGAARIETIREKGYVFSKNS